MLDATSFRNRLIAARIATENSIRGCSEEEIEDIRSTLKLPLPRTYVDFLRVAGKRAGAFMRDIDFLYPEVLTLRTHAEDILQNWEEGQLMLPANAFVFSMRRGEQFMFFEADGKRDDPPIWFYIEDGAKFDRIAGSLWDVIESELQLSEAFRRDYPNSPLIPDPE
jgi:hypothetical protein